MNLVKQITDQLSSNVLEQLGSLLGTDTNTLQKATTAAVPSLLSLLSGLTTSDAGTKKLTDSLGGLDIGSLSSNFGQLIGGNNASSVMNSGNNLLGTLFGDTIVSGLTSTLSRFTGLNPGVIKSLLAYLLPLVLGQIGSVWKSQGGTANALKSLFDDQRNNIANSVPAGYSLADLPGLRDVKDSGYSAARRPHPEPAGAGSAARWLLPLALAVLAALFLWRVSQQRKAEQVARETVEETQRTKAEQVARETVEEAQRTTDAALEEANRIADETRRSAEAAVDRTVDEVQALRPELPDLDMPDLKQLLGIIDVDPQTHFNDFFASVHSAFDEIKDAASADMALAKVQQLQQQVSSMNDKISQLPESARAALKPLIEEHVKTVTTKGKAITEIEGIGDEIKRIISDILTKIANWIAPSSERQQ